MRKTSVTSYASDSEALIFKKYNGDEPIYLTTGNHSSILAGNR